ncbi:hypothetical protein GCM10009665_26530 [Kitasatospora nipponensis]|uniref:Uncharacterized protein n=1 Tax=Kitasatospora nipponensis TaxID=258049 RepID=A0ABN1W7L9_9ACTN
MSTNRPRRIDRDATELLLARATDGTKGGQGPLADLLAAAAAPATARELVGEEAAVAAFRRSAHLTAPAPRARRGRTVAGCAPSRSLAAKIAAAAHADAPPGGVAVAASTGNLPKVLGGNGPDDGPAAAPTGAPSGDGRGPAVAKPLPDTTGGASALRALCRDWRSAGQSTADPRFDPLRHAAGTSSQVDAYCGKLAATAGAGTTPDATAQSADADASAGHGKSDADPSTAAHGKSDADPSAAAHGKSDATPHPDKPTPVVVPTPTDDRGAHTHTPAPPDATPSGHTKQ